MPSEILRLRVGFRICRSKAGEWATSADIDVSAGDTRAQRALADISSEYSPLLEEVQRSFQTKMQDLLALLAAGESEYVEYDFIPEYLFDYGGCCLFLAYRCLYINYIYNNTVQCLAWTVLATSMVLPRPKLHF